MVDRARVTVVVVLFLFVALIFLVSMQNTQFVTVQEGFIKDIKEFQMGEKITFYQVPDFLTPEQEEALKKYAEVSFFEDKLPDSYVKQAKVQDSGISETGNVTSLVLNTNVTQSVGQVTPPTLKTNDIGTTHKRGSIVMITGKIEKTLTQPPYFFNVIVTCCGMNSFRAMSAVETDGAGNFVIKIATDGHYPLGEWTIDVSTISDDKKIISHVYRFTLVE